jgi:hypothetical protein
MGRRSLLVGTVAGLAALFVTLGGVQANAGAGPEAAAIAVAVGGADYRLMLADAGDGAYTARLTTADSDGAWTPAAGARITFALVGEGALTGPALCLTPSSGECRIGASAAGSDAATLAAAFAGAAVTVVLGG